MSSQPPAPPSAVALQRLVAGELSPAGRLGYVALLLVAVAVVFVTASLWLTETGLPLRTHVAFGVLTAIGVSWVTFASWTLTSKRPLLAAHRVLAARMALAFSAVFVVGSLVVSVLTPDGTTARAAAAFGVVLCVVAGALLRRAAHRMNALRARRAELEIALGR